MQAAVYRTDFPFSTLPFLTCGSLESPPKRSFFEAGAHDPYCSSFDAGAQKPY